MEVILREDIEKLGNRGQIVKVADGYARNFLLPKRLAVPATEANKKIVEQERQAHVRREAKLKGEAEDLAKLLNGVSVTITQKAGEMDQLFGSVTSKDIAEALREAELHHRPPQDPPGRADQAARPAQGRGEASPRRHRRDPGERRQRRGVGQRRSEAQELRHRQERAVDAAQGARGRGALAADPHAATGHVFDRAEDASGGGQLALNLETCPHHRLGPQLMKARFSPAPRAASRIRSGTTP